MLLNLSDDISTDLLVPVTPRWHVATPSGPLDSFVVDWYATGMERILTVRKALDAHANLDCARRLDDRLYGWHNTLSALRH